MAKLLPPIHPGETIREDVLNPLDMSVNQLAKALRVDTARLNEIVRVWIGLQADYDLRVARHSKLKKIEREVKPKFRAA